MMGPAETDLRDRLTAAFQPTEMTIRNDSHRHAGHAGDDGSGESHFHVTLRSAALAPLSRVDRHRAVQRAIGDLTTRIHALALDLG
jgi:BolA family transcriptional regulator, general stress-responsive regulator